MRGLLVAASLQDIGETGQVALSVGRRVNQGVADPGLGCQVNDSIIMLPGKECDRGRPVGQVSPDKTERGMTLQPLQAGLFQGNVVVIVQIVAADYAVAAGKEALGQMVADESGSAGDKNVLHGNKCLKTADYEMLCLLACHSLRAAASTSSVLMAVMQRWSDGQ